MGGGAEGCFGGFAPESGPALVDKGSTDGEEVLSDGCHCCGDVSSPLPFPFLGGGNNSLPIQLPTEVERSGALAAAPPDPISPAAFDLAPALQQIGSWIGSCPQVSQAWEYVLCSEGSSV